MLADDNNPSHHYVGLLYFGYYTGMDASTIINFGRDYNNLPDIRLGTIASIHGGLLRGLFWNITPLDLPELIRRDLY